MVISFLEFQTFNHGLNKACVFLETMPRHSLHLKMYYVTYYYC